MIEKKGKSGILFSPSGKSSWPWRDLDNILIFVKVALQFEKHLRASLSLGCRSRTVIGGISC